MVFHSFVLNFINGVCGNISYTSVLTLPYNPHSLGRITRIIIRITFSIIEFLYISDVIARRYNIGQSSYASQQADNRLTVVDGLICDSSCTGKSKKILFPNNKTKNNPQI